jgi:hypothetical protein
MIEAAKENEEKKKSNVERQIVDRCWIKSNKELQTLRLKYVS